MSILSSGGSYLGIDIGSTSVKVVELKKEGNQVKLLTYGFSESRDGTKFDLQQDIEHLAEVITRIGEESGASARSAVSALPTFSVFSSVLNLTNVTKKDLPAAVHWEAKKVIPLPLEDMILDWKRIDEEESNKAGNVRVLLTGAPRTLVKRYIDIFKVAGISLLSLETETFSLVRSLVGNDKAAIMLVELGASTSDVTIVDRGIPMLNRSIDIGGITITRAIAQALGADFETAEQFKYDLGVAAGPDSNAGVPDAVTKTVAPIVNEIKYALNLYQNKNNKKTEKIILSGGSSLIPGLSQHLSKLLDLTVIIGDPWMRITYPPDLKPLLAEIGPRMSVAIGLAMREIG